MLDVGRRWWFLMFGITHLILIKKTLHWKTHTEASPSAAVPRCLVLNAWVQCIKITQLNAWAWNSLETEFWDCLRDTDSLSLALSPGIWIPIKFSIDSDVQWSLGTSGPISFEDWNWNYFCLISFKWKDLKQLIRYMQIHFENQTENTCTNRSPKWVRAEFICSSTGERSGDAVVGILTNVIS